MVKKLECRRWVFSSDVQQQLKDHIHQSILFQEVHWFFVKLWIDASVLKTGPWLSTEIKMTAISVYNTEQ